MLASGRPPGGARFLLEPVRNVERSSGERGKLHGPVPSSALVRREMDPTDVKKRIRRMRSRLPDRTEAYTVRLRTRTACSSAAGILFAASEGMYALPPDLEGSRDLKVTGIACPECPGVLQ